MEAQRIPTLSKKILFTIFAIIVIRIGNFVPIPNVDQRYLIDILNSNPSLKAFFNSEHLILSVFSLGIIPSINASIIIQLLTSSVPYLEKLQKEEGETGRRQIKQYTRVLTLGFAILESLSIALALRPILFNWSIFICGQIVLTLTTGCMIVLWLSDLITEEGIGNGSSLVITLNILSSLPTTIKTLVSSGNNVSIIISFLGLTSLIIGIIYVQEAVRVIPLVSAKQLFAQQNQISNNTIRASYLPLKINQGGVMPIIFSSTFLTFLTIIVNYVLNLGIIQFEFNDPRLISLIYGGINFFLILIFSVFYSNLILNPKEIAKDLNKMAVTIPNIRPGQQTASFLKKTLNRLSLLGAVFLAILVAIPNIRSSYGFGVTSLLILVGVTVDTTRQIQTLLISEIY
jgi:preprotein translocase subunit SecY|tara:strand:+ start:10033 stop:11235 length:1203 start_codon:yes stop_codon:yes gene_type:complete